MSTPLLVESFYSEIWNAGDMGANRLLAEDFSFRGSLGRELKGREAFIDYVGSVRSPLADYRCEILECVATAFMVEYASARAISSRAQMREVRDSSTVAGFIGNPFGKLLIHELGIDIRQPARYLVKRDGSKRLSCLNVFGLKGSRLWVEGAANQKRTLNVHGASLPEEPSRTRLSGCRFTSAASKPLPVFVTT